MGACLPPDPARVVLGVLFADAEILERARGRLVEVLGPVQRVGDEMDFTWTRYYEAEMGPGLRRCFLSAGALVPREILADLKRWTNRLESELAHPDGRRRINIDPGLMSLDNFVLATTKSQPHRLYLRDGIFAEVTLVYTRGGFQPLERTYPDYRSEEVRKLMDGIRKEYKRDLRAGSKVLVAFAIRGEVST
ncbi:MAG: DUF4416 family protein [Deltaproteobacteria bacterium]|nr:DUF4416 family protein [Deltaproteobacteria bacterium]